MNICLVSLSRPIRWLVTHKDPIVIKANFFDHLGFLNPIAVYELEQSDPGHTYPHRFAYLHNSVLVIETYTVGIVTAGGGLDEQGQVELATEEMPAFLSILRYMSKQVELPLEISSVYSTDIKKMKKLLFPHAKIGFSGVVVGKYRGRTAISAQMLKRAAKATNSLIVPVSHSVLMDAVEALRVSDYRKAILYSAIAMESMASEVLDNQYKRLLSKRTQVSPYRVIELTESAGRTVKKDPVYKQLEAKDDFAFLLHVRPLYLLKKSLLCDNAELYQSALKVYKTRNGIVHKGLPMDTSGKLLSLTREGATEALQCTLGVFDWFGEDISSYALPDTDLMPTLVPTFSN